MYWTNGTAYEAALERAVAYICQQTGCPSIAEFLRRQSHEETDYGAMFTARNNYWNMGAVDDNPQAAPTLATPEAGGQCWLDFLGWSNPSSTYAPFVALAKQGVSDVLTLATAIKAGGWATDPTYPQDVTDKA